MAIGTFGRSVLVKHDDFFAYEPGLRVTFNARHVAVASGKRKMNARIVIECGGNPAHGVVAIGAVRSTIFGCELSIVRVRMAGFAE